MSLSTGSDGAARTRNLARLAALIGSIASLALFAVASHKSPPVLIILIGAWVVAPYVGFFLADRFVRHDAAVYGALLSIVTISLAVYLYAVFGSPAWKAAAPFVAVPLLSWALLAIACVFAMLKPQPSKANHG